MAISVAVAVGHVADELIDKAKTRASTLSIHDGEATGADMRSIVTAAAKARMRKNGA